jgi:hypothetical protein
MAHTFTYFLLFVLYNMPKYKAKIEELKITIKTGLTVQDKELQAILPS